MNRAYIEACARRMHPDLNWPEPAPPEVKSFIDRYNAIDGMQEVLELLAFDGINMPFMGTHYITATVKHWIDGEWIIDKEATLKNLARVIKYARKLKYKVEKDYNDDNFTVLITTPHGAKLTFAANREAICEKKVVGEEYVPAYTVPGHVKEIVEWDCEPVALTQIEV